MLLNEIEINPSFDLDALEEGVHSLFGADDLLDQVDEDYMNDGMEIVPKNVKDTIKNHVSEILKDEHFRSQLDDEVAAELDAITKTAKFST